MGQMSSAVMLTDNDHVARQRVSAFLQEALETLDVRALNELLKPFGKDGFEELIARLIASRVPDMPVATLEPAMSNRHAHPSRIAFKTSGKIVIVSTRKIEW